MRTPSTDIFGPVEEDNVENIEEEVEEEGRKKRSLKRKRRKRMILAAPKRKENGVRYVKTSGRISKKPT